MESMAVELVQSALVSVLSRPECQVQTERSRLVRETSERVTAAISKAENKSQFESFAEKLVDLLSRPVSDAVKLSCSQSAKRERMWKAFHRARSTTVEALWKTFLSNVHIDDLHDNLFFQLVVDYVFEEVIKKEFHTSSTPTAPKKSLTRDEQNIIRYAGGYVAQRLLTRYKKEDSEKAAGFIESLSHMAVDGNESSLMDYTKEWTKKINRGGLFELSDNTFQLFQAIELALCHRLVTRLRDEDSEDKTAIIINSVAQDEEVLFYWSMNSIDIAEETHSTELLSNIISLWVTIRGFSIASTWMEEYKRATSTTKPKHSLRKGLRELSKDD